MWTLSEIFKNDTVINVNIMYLRWLVFNNEWHNLITQW